MTLIQAETAPQIETIKELLRDYASSLGFDLDFQDFAQELALLPGRYAPPGGCLLLALEDGEAAGCAALQKIALPGLVWVPTTCCGRPSNMAHAAAWRG
jgi:putative acetyltransferase